ncbi:glycosyltransferase [Bifidobacterium adolescentis]|uniref:glycosyltransferase n=1 Tax=Bifidobacterium adolescentis TaxID=1680 RepID=UPI004064967D
MMAHQPIRVLHVVPSLSKAGGVERFVFNMARFHDENRVHYDFLHHDMHEGKLLTEPTYEHDLQELGSKVYRVENAGKDLLEFSKQVSSFFKEKGEDYDVVHCHMPNTAFWVLRDAFKSGVKIRVQHSHLNTSSDVFLHRLRNAPLIALGKPYITDCVACSQEAGRYLFGSRSFMVINNGIPLEQFKYDSQVRYQVRSSFGIEQDAPVIGCVGRFVSQKNFPFAVRVFAKFHEAFPDSKMLILGDGDGRADLEKVIMSEHLSDAVILAGVREDIDKLYSAMDVFFMPSLYEGLPVSAVEAQAAGLPCVYSTKVPKETDITGTGTFLSLDAELEKWVYAFERNVNSGRLMNNPVILEQRGYSARANAELLMRHYESLMAVSC